jgi:putative glycosyltransferase (TIGR04372 family)
MAGLRVFILSKVKNGTVSFAFLAYAYKVYSTFFRFGSALIYPLPSRWLPIVFLEKRYASLLASKKYEKARKVAITALKRDVVRHKIYIFSPIFYFLGDSKYCISLFFRAEKKKKTEKNYFKFESTNIRYFSPYYFGNYGHCAHLELYLRAQALGLMNKRQNVFIGAIDTIPGRAILEVYKDWMEFRRSASHEEFSHALLFGEIPNLFEHSNGQKILMAQLGAEVEREWYARHSKPAFALPGRHVDCLSRFLTKHQIGSTAWWVTFHVRNDKDPTRSLRDASLENYIPAMRYVIENGGYVVRLGDASLPPLPAMDRVIDLAYRDDYSPELDIAFVAKSRFSVCVNSGPAYVAGLFDRPALMTNWPNLGNIPWYRKYRLLPRHAHWIKTGQELSLFDRCGPEFGHSESHLGTEPKGVIFSENTAEEILEAVKEMFNDEEEVTVSNNQKIAMEIFQRNGLHPIIVDDNFLKNTPDFLIK